MLSSRAIYLDARFMTGFTRRGDMADDLVNKAWGKVRHIRSFCLGLQALASTEAPYHFSSYYHAPAQLQCRPSPMSLYRSAWPPRELRRSFLGLHYRAGLEQVSPTTRWLMMIRQLFNFYRPSAPGRWTISRHAAHARRAPVSISLIAFDF